MSPSAAATTDSRSPLKNEKSQSKLVVKVKRKKKSKSAGRAAVAIAQRAALPRLDPQTVAAAQLRQREEEQAQSNRNSLRYISEQDDAIFEAAAAADGGLLLSDTLCLIQSLVTAQSLSTTTDANATNSVASTNLPIPLSNNNCIHAVLECQLFPSSSLSEEQQQERLDQNLVYAELNKLRRAGKIVQLAPPTKLQASRLVAANDNKNEPLLATDITLPVALLTMDHYRRGVWDAQQQQHERRYQEYKNNGEADSGNNNSQSDMPSLTSAQQLFVLEWFLEKLPSWTGTERILLQDIEDVWIATREERQGQDNGQDNSDLNLKYILQYLVDIQVLLPSHATNSYQLWLPTWPIVLKTLEKRCASLLIQLKRSLYKELSLKAIIKQQERRSPIQGRLLVDYLISLNRVKVQTRAQGVFVRLVVDA